LSNQILWSVEFCLQSTAQCLASDPAPNLSFIPAMSRRRLSPLARMALYVAYELEQGAAPQRMVFASRHGEIGSTVAMLRDVAQHQPVSPAAFSHSVHNAIAGVWSIFQQHFGECSAIAAGRDSLVMALIEANGFLLDDATTPVLVLLADEALPACFTPYFNDPTPHFALGLLLGKGATNVRVSALENHDIASDEISDWQAWWRSNAQVAYQRGERQVWRWEKI
jgi:hypothetical protein